MQLFGHSAQDARNDIHLNELGHRVVADRLAALLRDNDGRTLKLGFPAPR